MDLNNYDLGLVHSVPVIESILNTVVKQLDRYYGVIERELSIQSNVSVDYPRLPCVYPRGI